MTSNNKEINATLNGFIMVFIMSSYRPIQSTLLGKKQRTSTTGPVCIAHPANHIATPLTMIL